ncbi:hypothetical protein MXB_708, partial [Myxobolus squamalis]
HPRLVEDASHPDNTVISEEVREIFDRVRQYADYMPWYQTNSVLSKSFGKNWKNEFLSFDVTLDKNEVAVKIQYPGVADSMLNDLQILSFFLTTLKLLPKSYFLENTINEMSNELSLETDYIREANNQEAFRKLFQDHPFIEIPKVYYEYSSPTILTSQYIYGMPIDYCTNLSQDTRDKIIYGASKGDRLQVELYSKELGFLTGYEDKIMTEAHIESVMILAEPFRREDQTITKRIGKLVPTMLEHRMTAPPKDTYSLHLFIGNQQVYIITAHVFGSCECLGLYYNFLQK